MALDDLRKEAYRLFLTSHAKVLKSIEADVTRARTLPPEVYDVLVTLEYAGGRMRLSDLADQILLSRSGLTRRLDKLEKMGYIQREMCPNDRRGAYAVLTDAGLKARARAWVSYSWAIEEHFASHLTEAEARTMVRVFEKIAAD